MHLCLGLGSFISITLLASNHEVSRAAQVASNGCASQDADLVGSCFGSVASPKALVAAIEASPALAKELGPRSVGRVTDLLGERAGATVQVSPAIAEGRRSVASVPATWEEVLAAFVLSTFTGEAGGGAGLEGLPGGLQACAMSGYGRSWAGQLRCDLLLLEGQAFAASGNLDAAEQRMVAAQRGLGDLGLGDTLAACMCHTSVAELFVQKHMAVRAERQAKAAEAAEAWLSSDEGHAHWRSEVRRLLASNKEMAEEGRLAKLEVEYRARQALLKAHASAIIDGEGAAASEHFDHAEEALLRVWEIHEASLGRNHPGTAAACLSLGNLCVINKDLPQAKLWFESVIAILDACFSGTCMQLTAATEAQFGHVEVKVGSAVEVSTPHLERAAAFYLDRAQHALASERARLKSKTASTISGAMASPENVDGSSRRVWLARKAHGLWSEVGGLWLREAKTNHSAAAKACSAFEKALSSVGAMHESGGEASADALRLLLGSLKAFGSALEVCGNWRRATDAFSQLRTLSARLLGTEHKITKNAATRARRAAAKAASQAPGQSKVQRSPKKSNMERASLSGTNQLSPEKPLDGEESWLS